MDTLREDLKHAARRLTKAPGFTLGAVLTLALGIGGNCAVLSALEALLLRPLPYAEPDRLVLLQQNDVGVAERPVAPANFLDWREQAHSFEGLAAYEVVGRTLLGRDVPLRVASGIVSTNFFTVLGVGAASGQTFTRAADERREAVLGNAFWRARFGGNPAIVGSELQLDDELVRVVGVMPPEFDFPREAELWLSARHDVPEIPIAPQQDPRSVRDARYLGVLGRLRPGVALATARAEMDVIALALAARYPEANAGNGALVSPLFEELRGAARPALLLLFAAAACVLLIACANVANLLLARAVGRRQEMAVRIALGASRTRLLRQLLTEAMLLVVLGVGGGLLLAWASRPAFVALWPASLPPMGGLRFSLPMLAIASLVAALSVLLVGLVPAREAARTDALAGLRASGRTPAQGREAHRARSLLLVAEVALAVVLSSAAALLLGSLVRLQRTALGFEAEGALTARVSLPRSLADDAEALRTMVAALERRLAELPGVVSVGTGQALPLSGRRVSAGLRVFGRPQAPNAAIDAGWRLVTPAWFAALRIPILRGRGFQASDQATAPAIALVNATLARQVFGDEDPLGRRVATGLDGPEGSWVEIVGVVADTPQENVARAVRPEMYRPLAQPFRLHPTSLSVVLRTGGDPAALAPALPAAVAAVRGDIALSDVVPLATLARESIGAQRAASQVLALFGVLALFLAALGVYGVVSCLVGERTHEMGVRLALGARPSSLLRLVLGRSLVLAGTGTVLGLLAALALARLLEALLFGVSPRDPATLAAVGLVLLAITLAAAWVPARRASRLDPAVVLRQS